MLEGQVPKIEHTTPQYASKEGRFAIHSAQQDAIQHASSIFHNEQTKGALEQAFSGKTTNREDVSLEARHMHFDQENVGDLLILSDETTRIYIRGDEIVYSSEQNSKSRFDNLAGFLSSPTDKKVEFTTGPVADVALFGTINNNLPGIVSEDWMKAVEQAISREGVSVFNPNLGAGTQSSGISMEQFAKESQHLFESPVVVMNFEAQRGGLALAELRMAMLACILTGHKLIVRMEKPQESRNILRSRAVAIEDITFFQERIPELKENMTFYDIDDITIPELATEAVKTVQDMQGKQVVKKKLSGVRQAAIEKVVLSGSSADARDIAMRLELKHQAKQEKGIDIVDTYVQSFGQVEGQGNDAEFAAMRQSRKEELEVLDSATDHIVYAGNSLSPFGQLTTALLFSVYNGSKLRGLILNPDLIKDIRDQYSSATYRNHTAKVVMDYQLAKIMDLLKGFEGIAPELQEYIPIIADAINPIVASFEKTTIESASDVKQDSLEAIADAERLVPGDYRPEIAEAVVRASSAYYSGYPGEEQRIHMTSVEYEAWAHAGYPAADLFEKYPSAYVGNHSNRASEGAQKAKNAGRMQDYDGSQTFPTDAFRSQLVDSHGAPLHPYVKEMLLAGVAVTGPGFYWQLGENPAADPMVLQVANGHLQALIITRNDSKTAQRHDALPGGMGDPEDAGLSQTLERELHEEIGMDKEVIRAFPRIENVYSGLVGDPRATIHAYPTTRLDVLLPTQDQLQQMVLLQAEDDAIGFHWMTLTEANIQKLFGMHPELVMMGIKAWQDATGVVVDKQGKIGKRG
ncbi:MAG TPA: NUDIX domain-containing protein [Patescibacteria group bacterium]|nr:NUDIX domain-containing protein [Patescibacteria group bacterium]